MNSAVNPLQKICRALLPVAFWLGAWVLAYRMVGQDLLLASPGAVLRTLWDLGGTLVFWRTVLWSLLRTAAGFGLGVLLGTVVAVLTSFCWPLALILRPALRAIRATPVSSFIILALVWLQKGAVPVLTGTLMVLPVIWGNVSQGIGDVDGQLLEMARMFGFSRWKRAWAIYVPGVLPGFFIACQTSLGLCWKASIAAEVLGVPGLAIGTQLYNAKIYLQTDGLLAWTLTVIFLSVVMERLFALGMQKLGRGYRGVTV